MTFPVIALDYYDGVTEGFMMHSDGARMFRMIAWDQDEDSRLFAVCDIPFEDFWELRRLLGGANTRSGGSVWMPSWEFGNEAGRQKANAIIRRCKELLTTHPDLVIGKHIDDAEVEHIPVPEEIRGDIVRSLSRQAPEDIADWLDKLKICSSESGLSPEFQRRQRRQRREGPSL